MLVATADHALLDPAMIAEFTARAEGADLALAVVESRRCSARFPQTKRTWIGFKGGRYSGANLFALRLDEVLPAVGRWGEGRAGPQEGLAAARGAWPGAAAWRGAPSCAPSTKAPRRSAASSASPSGLSSMSNPIAAIDVDKPLDHALVEDHHRRPRMTDLAIYDMDRTVTRHATYTPFLLHCAVRRAPWRLLLLPLVALSMLAYAARLIDRAKLKDINHRLLLGRTIHPRDLQPLVDSFADNQLRKNIRPGARAAIARDKAEGRRLVLATASYRLYADAIAERLGFDDVIGTGSIIGLDERVHAKIAGENCYGPAKLRMIADWVDELGLKGAHGHVRFYSDHVSDQPAFEWADEPVAVNPHGKLRRIAEERGWRIENWS